jgi:adenosylhomocysteine nucleosidase
MKALLTVRRVVVTFFCCLLLLFAASALQATVGIITALDTTLEQIKNDIGIVQYSVVAGREFYQGGLEQTAIVLVRSPMGKVNNAITAQLLITTFNAKAVVSISPAGAVSSDIRVGDVILATEVYQHDFGTWKPYGFIWSNVPIYEQFMTTDYNRFPGQSLQRIPQQPMMTDAATSNKIIRGIVVSGDQFIASPEKRAWLQKKFKAAAVDMGAAAIAQVCYVNTTPVLLVRVVTDSAGLDARTMFTESMPGYQTTLDLPGLIKQYTNTIIQ